MLKIVAIMICGIGVGVLLRGRRLSQLPRVTTGLVWVLLFLLGSEVGQNSDIMSNLSELGIEAMLLCLAGVVGSIALAWLLWRHITMRRKGVDAVEE